MEFPKSKRISRSQSYTYAAQQSQPHQQHQQHQQPYNTTEFPTFDSFRYPNQIINETNGKDRYKPKKQQTAYNPSVPSSFGIERNFTYDHYSHPYNTHYNRRPGRRHPMNMNVNAAQNISRSITSYENYDSYQRTSSYPHNYNNNFTEDNNDTDAFAELNDLNTRVQQLDAEKEKLQKDYEELNKKYEEDAKKYDNIQAEIKKKQQEWIDEKKILGEKNRPKEIDEYENMKKLVEQMKTKNVALEASSEIVSTQYDHKLKIEEDHLKKEKDNVKQMLEYNEDLQHRVNELQKEKKILEKELANEKKQLASNKSVNENITKNDKNEFGGNVSDADNANNNTNKKGNIDSDNNTDNDENNIDSDNIDNVNNQMNIMDSTNLENDENENDYSDGDDADHDGHKTSDYPPESTVIQNLLQAQIEYYFSDYNLKRDKKLLEDVLQEPKGFLKIDEVMTFARIRQLCCDKHQIIEAIQRSKILVRIDDMIGRPSFEKPKEKDFPFRRTVFIFGIPKDCGEEFLKEMLSPFGKIIKMQFDSGENSLERRIGLYFLQKPRVHIFYRPLLNMDIHNNNPTLQPIIREITNENSNDDNKNNNSTESTIIPNVPKINKNVIPRTPMEFKTSYKNNKQITCHKCKKHKLVTDGFYTCDEWREIYCSQCAASLAENQLKEYYEACRTNKTRQPADRAYYLGEDRKPIAKDFQTALVVFISQRQASKCAYVRTRIAYKGVFATHYHHFAKLKKETMQENKKMPRYSTQPLRPTKNPNYQHRFMTFPQPTGRYSSVIDDEELQFPYQSDIDSNSNDDTNLKDVGPSKQIKRQSSAPQVKHTE